MALYPRATTLRIDRHLVFATFGQHKRPGERIALELLNPENVCPPLGLYSHIVKVPAGSELYYISGQLGVDADGVAPDSIGEQADLVFSNIVKLLESQGLAATNIAKLTTYMVAGQDGQEVRKARIKHLGDHRPASTAVYVSQLVDSDWLVEVEAVACRS